MNAVTKTDKKELLRLKKLAELDDTEKFYREYPSPSEYKLACIELAREILNSPQWEMLKSVHLNMSWLWYEVNRNGDGYIGKLDPRGCGIVYDELTLKDGATHDKRKGFNPRDWTVKTKN